MFAHFLMRRTAFLALALTAPLVAYAAAAPATQHPKPHHSKVHHPKSEHPAPHHPKRPTSPEVKTHHQLMRAETARNKSMVRMHEHEDVHLKADRRRARVTKAEAKHRAREAKKNNRKARKTAPAIGNTVGESRLEMERRSAEELQARYDEGYKAGYEAGLEAARKERMSAGVSKHDETPHDFGAQAPASAAPVTVAHTATAPGGVDAAGSAIDSAAAGTLAAPEREPASLDVVPATHQPPVSLQASFRMLHERMPPPLRGSLASLERQNERLDAEGLQRIEDNSDLESRIAHGLLVPLPVSDGMTVNPSLPDLRRYCRPWTAEFLSDLGKMHEAVFHRPLRVDSAVRTVDYQERLRRINANAAPAQGDIASPHETGATIDIGKRGMTWREVGWMRHYLLTLQDEGLIDVEEEFRQACFHITVYDTYGRVQPASTTAGNDFPYEFDRGSDRAAVEPVDSRGQ